MMSAPAKTSEVFAYLKGCAADMRTVTYQEVADHAGLPPVGMGRPLRRNRDETCRSRGLPWLNAIAVRSETRRPGDRFLPVAIAVGRDEQRMWRGMVLQVFALDWGTAPFDQSPPAESNP